MEAFRAAVDEGADMSELDVWLSADGVPMVHHDEAVGSPARPIGSLRRAELASNKATAHIPPLDDVMEWSRGRMGLYIELKGPKTAEPVAELVRRHDMARHVVELEPLFAAAPAAVCTNMPARAAAIREERARPGDGDST